MPFEITMPQLGLTMEKGTIVDWLVGEGDKISAGQEIFQVETDKSVVAVEARVTGILTRILVPAGQEVAVGTVLAIGVAPGEVLSAGFRLPTQIGAGVGLPALPALEATPSARSFQDRLRAGAGAVPTLPRRRPGEASWKARTLARQAGLDLGRTHYVENKGRNQNEISESG